MKNDVLVLDLSVNGMEEFEENVEPVMEKPEDECFWCGGELDQDILDSKRTGFGRYYAKCRECMQHYDPEKQVFIAEVIKVPTMLDQPMYNAAYPTGARAVLEREDAAQFMDIVSEGQLTVDGDTQEIMLSHAAFVLLIRFLGCEGPDDGSEYL